MISKKIILTGSFGVGKTSLFNKFLYNKFSDRYLTTIGVKVDKKPLTIDGVDLTLMLWDIAGEVSQDKVPHSYFLGASGIIYVFDLTRPSTFVNMASDIEYIQSILPGINLQIVGNKKDLVTPEHLAAIKNELPIKYDILTSAKTGEHVEDLFLALGKALITNTVTKI